MKIVITSFLILLHISLLGQVHGQHNHFTVFYTQGQVQGIDKDGKRTVIRKGASVDSLQFLVVGKQSWLTLVNGSGIPRKLQGERIYIIKDLDREFLSDAITTKYFKYIWEEFEMKPHEQVASRLNIIATTEREGLKRSEPQITCPIDSTIISEDTIHFSWYDSISDGTCYLYILDIDNWTILFNKGIQGGMFDYPLPGSQLLPGREYAWMVSRDSIWSPDWMHHVFKIPDPEWILTYRLLLSSRNVSEGSLYGRLNLAYFFLEMRQFCEAKDLLRILSRENSGDEFIMKTNALFIR